MRRALALLAVVTLAMAGCADAKRPPLERVTGNIGPSDVDNGGTSPDSAGGSATSGGPGTSSGTESATGTDTDTGTGTGDGTDPGAPAGGSGQVAAATAALDGYLDALGAQDFKAAQRVSTGGPRFMATVRDMVARYNAERDGTTKLSYSARSFTVSSSAPNRVTFAGQAKLDSTTSGPAGSPRSDSITIASPVIALAEGSWRVSDYEIDGARIAHFPASSRRSVGGVDLRLQGGLSFGTSTALVIDLVSDADHSIRVDNVQITYSDGTTAGPTLRALISQKPAALYFLFDRVSSPPVSWSATVTVDAGTKNETADDVVLRF